MNNNGNKLIDNDLGNVLFKLYMSPKIVETDKLLPLNEQERENTINLIKQGFINMFDKGANMTINDITINSNFIDYVEIYDKNGLMLGSVKNKVEE